MKKNKPTPKQNKWKQPLFRAKVKDRMLEKQYLALEKQMLNRKNYG